MSEVIQNDTELDAAEVNTYASSNGCGYEKGRCENDCIDGSAWLDPNL